MSESGMRQIEAIIRREKFPSVDKALRDIGVSGVTMVEARGRGRDKIITTSFVRGKWTFTTDVIHRVIVNVVVDASDVDKVVNAIVEGARHQESRRREDIRLSHREGDRHQHRRGRRPHVESGRAAQKMGKKG